MRWAETVRLRLRGVLFRKQEHSRLQEEMEFHLEALIAENLAAGLPPDEARYAAMRAFGNATVADEQTQETWGWMWLERLLQDLRFAIRQIRRAPGFALIAILTLALGIGANTAVFTLTHALLLQGLPIPEPDRLVRLAIDLRDFRPDAPSDAPLNLPFIQLLNRRSHTLQGVFGWSPYGFRPQLGDNRRAIRGAAVTGNAFQILGIRPAAGRLINPADDQPGSGPDGWAGVISYRDWVQRYHMDPSVVGRHITVTDHPVTIVGVAPPEFEGVMTGQQVDLYLPIEFDAALNGEEGLHRGDRLWLMAFGRLRPGASREETQAELSAIFPAMQKEVLPPRMLQEASVRHARLVVRSGGTGWSELRTLYTKPLLMLQSLVGVVLLICCANLSGLFLARAAARQQEFAVRVALGAARGRLMRQLFVEGLMLALPGAALGIALAWMAGPGLLRLLSSNHLEIAISTQPDMAVLAVTVSCTLLCTLLFGMAPAWMAAHANVESGLRNSSMRVAISSSGVRRFFVPFQVALSLVLFVFAVLLGSSVLRLRTNDSGYQTQGVYFFVTDWNRIPQKGADLLPLYRRMAARLRSMPGIISASLAEFPPLFDMGDEEKYVPGTMVGKAQPVPTWTNTVGNGFFATVGTPLLAGRDLRNDETDAGSCVVNEAAAAKFFPNQSALGQQLRRVPYEFSDPDQTSYDCQVIGVVKNAKYDTLDEEFQPIVYLPISTRLGPRLTSVFLVMKATSMAAADAAQLTALAEIAPTAPQDTPGSFAEIFDNSIAQQRLLCALSGFFAILGLLLSAIGIYGLVAWSVTQRTREIGVRMALGATRLRVFGLVMRQVAILLAVGVAVGGAAAFFAARSIRSFLFEIQADDPALFAISALTLVLIGLLAAMLPARRAVSIDPMRALRTE